MPKYKTDKFDDISNLSLNDMIETTKSGWNGWSVTVKLIKERVSELMTKHHIRGLVRYLRTVKVWTTHGNKRICYIGDNSLITLLTQMKNKIEDDKNNDEDNETLDLKPESLTYLISLLNQAETTLSYIRRSLLKRSLLEQNSIDEEAKIKNK
jgi:hypothetical protein